MTIPCLRLVLPLGFVAAASMPLVAQTGARSGAAPARASAPGRVTVTAGIAPAYSCAAITCRVITELEKGSVLSVLKADGEWYQVMLRVGTSATTGWVRSAQVAAADPTTSTRMAGTASGATLPGQGGAPAALGEDDPRGCLTCLATRDATKDEWNSAMAETAKVKGTRAAPAAAAAPADARSDGERMRDFAEKRYGEELKKLADEAITVDQELRVYLTQCVERFASIPVAGAPPRATKVDDMLKAARATRSAARFALWNGTAAFQWDDAWEATPDPNSTLPSCPRIWEDARARADRLKLDVEALERDAREHDVYPGVIREVLAARNLAESTQQASAPVLDLR